MHTGESGKVSGDKKCEYSLALFGMFSLSTP